MRIVGQNAWPVFRGGEKAMALIMAGLQGRGHDVLLVCANAAVARRCAEFGLDTAVVKLSGDLMLNRSVRFARILRRYRPDAVLLGTFRKAMPAVIGARLGRVPRVVLRVGSAAEVPDSAKYRILLRHLADAVVVNAVEMRRAFLAADPGLHPDRVVAIPTGVRRPSPADPDALRMEPGLEGAGRLIGSIAYIAPLKRLERIIRALPLLPSDVHYVHAGDGPGRPGLEALATELGVAGRVHFLGYRPDVGTLLAALDVYVATSDMEGMSNAMLEALMLGVPVVSTPVSGAREALEPFGDGTAPGIIAGPDPADIAAAIRTVLDDPAVLRSMQEAASRRAMERYGYDRMIDDYEAVLAAPASSPRP